MKQLKCIIADDEPLAARLLQSYAERHDRLELAGVFTSATEALATLAKGGIDVAFLDIQMPGLSGMEIARTLEGSSTRVIFVTAFRDYAVEGFRVNALDYLLKPVSFEEFSGAVDRALAAFGVSEQNDGHIMVRSDYRLVKIDFSDILYVEGLKDYVKIYTISRERPVLTLMSLKAVEQALPENDFIRVHRSFIVAIKHISSVGRCHAMIGQESIPVGDTYRARFFERIKS